jgi:hypothetical protein
LDDLEKWISREDATEWLVHEYRLSIGAAVAMLNAAIDSGNVRCVARFGEERVPVLARDLQRFPIGLLLGEKRLNLDDLRWQVQKQPLPQPSGIRTNREAYAEVECRHWLENLTERPAHKDAAFEAAREAVASVGTLTRKAFDHAWRDAAPDEWKKQGRPRKQK